MRKVPLHVALVERRSHSHEIMSKMSHVDDTGATSERLGSTS